MASFVCESSAVAAGAIEVSAFVHPFRDSVKRDIPNINIVPVLANFLVFIV